MASTATDGVPHVIDPGTHYAHAREYTHTHTNIHSHVITYWTEACHIDVRLDKRDAAAPHRPFDGVARIKLAMPARSVFLNETHISAHMYVQYAVRCGASRRATRRVV